mmetsp:Transcript_102500/g.187265  ORF Transcript_102500/g.187265 Transcript_102500/m.187265 type:complete len:1052 (+) Transcript_102500:127-3282(+)
MVGVRVTHALYDLSVLVDVPPTADLLDVRWAMLKKAGANDLQDVLLVSRSPAGFKSLRDDEPLQDRTELLALGCNSVFFPDDKLEVPAPSTLELINEGRAVGYSTGRFVQVGETIRVEASGWNASEANSFRIRLQETSGDIALQWLASESLRKVKRTSRIENLAGSATQEIAGGWPFGKSTEDLIIDFELAPCKWKVSINGKRLPAFDYGHRAPIDVSEVECSQTLINPKVILITKPDDFSTQEVPVEPLRPSTNLLRVTHAFWRTSVEVSVPRNASFKDVRRQLCKKTKSTSIDEFLLVQSDGNMPGIWKPLSDDAQVNNRTHILTLGSNLAFRVRHSKDMESALAKAKVTGASTEKLLKNGQARLFSQGHTVLDGETIRVEASGWDNNRPATKYNSFTIDLMSESGDMLFHWGARFTQRKVVRNSALAGHWSVEESSGDWPHRQPHSRTVVDFMRAPSEWQVSVNGVRQPQFDFAHRSGMAVTRVRCSDNLYDAKILLCSSGPVGQQDRDVEFAHSAEHEQPGDSKDLAVGRSSGQVDVAQMATNELIELGHAEAFKTGRAVQIGETVRVEARGWDANRPATKYNSFTVDLESAEGDIILAWGARFARKCVVRNSKLSGARWGSEEMAGGWPHGSPRSRIRIDFTRSETRWQVSINGSRSSEFDFVHRSNDNVTDVHLSSNLYDPRVTLITTSAVHEPCKVDAGKVKTSLPPRKLSKKAASPSRKVRTTSAAASSGAGALRAAAAFAVASDGTPLTYTVVDQHEVPVMESPCENAAQIGTLRQGDIAIGYPGGHWLRLVEFNGEPGWALCESASGSCLAPEWASARVRRTPSGSFSVEWHGIPVASTYSLVWRDPVGTNFVESDSACVIINELIEGTQIEVLITANIPCAQGKKVRVSGAWCQILVPISCDQEPGCKNDTIEEEENFMDAESSFLAEGDTTLEEVREENEQDLVTQEDHHTDAATCEESMEIVDSAEQQEHHCDADVFEDLPEYVDLAGWQEQNSNTVRGDETREQNDADEDNGWTMEDPAWTPFAERRDFFESLTQGQ